MKYGRATTDLHAKSNMHHQTNIEIQTNVCMYCNLPWNIQVQIHR